MRLAGNFSRPSLRGLGSPPLRADASRVGSAPKVAGAGRAGTPTHLSLVDRDLFFQDFEFVAARGAPTPLARIRHGSAKVRGNRATRLRAFLAVVAVVAAFALSRDARAGEETNEGLFQGAVAALGSGALDEAIDRFELLADRGFYHPDASYDRAIAYVRRASSRGAHPGDLGRAAAGLSEAVALRDGDDADAKLALDRVRQEIARRRSHAGGKQVDEQKPSLGWAVVGLLGEDVWALLAIFGSAVATVGLALRFVAGKDAVRLAGVVAASLGIGVATVTGSLAFLARYERVHFRQAVVVVDEAHLLDENGANISGPGSVVPEGAAVRVTGERGTLAHVEWGTLDGWLSFGQLRLLARRDEP